MSYKFKFFPKPISTNINTSVESFLLELFVGIIGVGFAYYGYQTGMLIVLVSAGIIGIACLLLCVHTIWGFLTQTFIYKR